MQAIADHIQQMEKALSALKNQRVQLIKSKNDINDDISRDVFKKYGFDSVSSNILFELFHQNEIKILCMDNKYYAKHNTTMVELDYMFSEEALRRGRIFPTCRKCIMSNFNILLNIQDGKFRRCRHPDGRNHGSCCTGDSVPGNMVDTLFKYLFRKIELLEQKINVDPQVNTTCSPKCNLVY